MEITKNRIIWDKDDWLAGLHPNYTSAGGDSPTPQGGSKLTYALSMNPYRSFSYAFPGFNPTDVSNVSVVSNGAIRRIVMGAESGTYYGYGVDSSTKFFQVDSSTGALTNAGIWPVTITSASGTVELNDVVMYSARLASVRAPRIFFSFNNAGAAAGNPLWNVGMYDLAGSAPTMAFMSTSPANPLDSTNTSTTSSASSKMPHPMIVGDDDVLYIGDGNYVHAYDGADTADPEGKFFAQVLTLPANFRVTSFGRLKQRLVIYGYKELSTSQTAGGASFYATEAKAYFWDYLALDPYDSVNLNDNYVSGGFEYRSTVGCFTQGRKPVMGSNQFAKIMLFNGTDFDCVDMIDDNIPLHGGVQVAGDTIMFNAGGKVYQWGSPYPGFPNGLNKVAAGLGTSSGAIITLNTALQVISTGATTTGGLQKITNQYSTGAFAGALASPLWPEGMTGRIKSVTVTFCKTSSGGRDFSLSFVGNDLSTTAVIANVSTIDSSNQRKKYAFDTSGSPLPKFSSIKPVITWGSANGATDAPGLEKIELEYETINLEST